MKTTRQLVIGLLLAFAAAACSSIREPNLIETLQNLGVGKYLDQPTLHPAISQRGDWQVYTYPTDELQCITGGEYFLMARPGSMADHTVLWMEGGGACWTGQEDCSQEALFYDWIETQGLASSDPDNPVRDWNFVYVPYCDGSLHLGDNQADYDGDGVVDHHHQGLRMTSVAVRLMFDLFSDTERILIAGCSAGGGGTIGAAPIVRLQFPQAKLYVLNIAGSALADPSDNQPMQLLQETWNTAAYIPDDCPRCQNQFIYLYDWLLARDTNLRVGMFSSYHDAMARSRWNLSADAFRSLILDVTGNIHEAHPDGFQRFFIDGDGHCLADYGYQVGGTSFWQWVGYLVGDDPRWTDLLQ